MNKPIKPLILAIALLVVAGCGRTATTSNTTTNLSSGIHYSTVNSDSDFTPPLGRAANPPAASAGERRLLLAHSTDGVHFTANGEVLTDQGNVPDVVIEADGTIRVYYIGQTIEANKEENTVVAISKDDGASWTFRKLTFNNFPQPRDPSDPDVVLLSDGTYRMYYTSSIGFTNKLGIVYAESSDGLTFTYKGESLTGSGDAVDSTTFYFNGLWHMYVLQEKEPGQLHATSTDGYIFDTVSDTPIRLPNDGYVISNPVIENGIVRMFGFSLKEHNLRSFTSTNMTTWTSDDIALAGDEAATLGSNYIQDSTVAQLSDGTYLMIYVSEIPR